MNVIFGNFYSPAFDDENFVDETMGLIKELGLTVLCLIQKPGKIFGTVMKPGL